MRFAINLSSAARNFHRGKSYSRAPHRLQITMAGTHTREPPPEDVHCGKRISRASYTTQIIVAQTHKRAAARRCPSRPKQQQSLLHKTNQNDRDRHRSKSHRRALYRAQITTPGHTQQSRRPKPPIAARATAQHSVERKSQWQRHTQESRRLKASIAATATAEPPRKRKSQWQKHTHKKINSRPSASTTASATAEPPIERN